MIKIKDWDKLQTFRKDRGSPQWIKVHRNLLSNENWASLSDAEKGQIISMWLVGADNNGELPEDPKIIRKICQLDDIPDISKFKDLGFLEDGCRMVDNAPPSCQPNDNQKSKDGCRTVAPEKSRVEKSRVEKNTPPPPKGADDDLDFLYFWNIYPKTRIGSKDKAWTAWKRAITKTSPQNLIDSANAYAKSRAVKEGFAKGCAAWLNDDGWNYGFLKPDQQEDETITETTETTEKYKFPGDIIMLSEDNYLELLRIYGDDDDTAASPFWDYLLKKDKYFLSLPKHEVGNWFMRLKQDLENMNKTHRYA